MNTRYDNGTVRDAIRRLAEDVPMIVWKSDAAGRCTYLNPDAMQGLDAPQDLHINTGFEEHIADPKASGYIACTERIAVRKPFHDVIYPVWSRTKPGVVHFLRISGEPFSEDGVFCGYRGVSRDVTHEVRTANALEHLATHDTLTELPNRALLQRRLRQCLEDRRQDAMLAVFFIDLDNFKEVNDSLGHAAGDVLLKDIAARLRQSVRPDDTVARLGGDEFVVHYTTRKTIRTRCASPASRPLPKSPGRQTPGSRHR